MSVEIVNLSAYEIPKAVEDKQKKWVAYGEDNAFYDSLTNAYVRSSTNNACIKSITDLVYGEGLCIDGLEKDSPEVRELYKIISHKCLKKVILDKKVFGDAAVQVIYSGSGESKKVQHIKHFPINTLRPQIADNEGNIRGYYYHPDWANKKYNEDVKFIPAFGFSNESIEIYVFRSYTPGYYYFSPIDYSGSLPYAELEDEISDYLLNEVKNSFSGTKLVNFNNGVPDPEQRRKISSDILNKLTGSRGQKVIVSFADNAESATTVEDISLNEAPSHYAYLAEESRNKILVGHRITSPMLLGIREAGGGLGNNADEIKTASQLFNSTVINVYQEDIAEQLEDILELNGERLNLYFITTQPVEFDIVDEEAETQPEDVTVEVEDDMGQREYLSEQVNFKTEDQVDWLTHLSKQGEEEPGDDWVMVNATVDLDEHEEENWEAVLNHALRPNPTLILAGVRANRAADSKQDSEWIKVRYKYIEKHNKSRKSYGSRPFCDAMISANRIYRKEDIIAMKGVNREHGHNMQPYSIWLWKGGVNCTHVWERRIYVKKSKLDGTPWGGNAFNGVKGTSMQQAIKKYGFNPNNEKWRNPAQVERANIDRPDRGHHPNYRK